MAKIDGGPDPLGKIDGGADPLGKIDGGSDPLGKINGGPDPLGKIDGGPPFLDKIDGVAPRCCRYSYCNKASVGMYTGRSYICRYAVTSIDSCIVGTQHTL